MRGDELREIMALHGITVPELASEAPARPESIEDYRRASRDVPKKVAEAAKRLAARTQERIVATRRELNALSRALYLRADIDRVDQILPQLEVEELEDFVNLVPTPDLANVDRALPQRITFEKWADVVWKRGAKGRRARTLVMGNPGGGKSTVSKLLIAKATEKGEGHGICCILPLSEFNRWDLESSPKSLLDVVIRYHREVLQLENRTGLDAEFFFKHEHKQGRLTIICDGFDEPRAELRETVRDLIERAECPTITTSRYIAPRLDASPPLTPHTYHLAGLTREQVVRYAGVVRDALSDTRQKEAISSLIATLAPGAERMRSDTPLVEEAAAQVYQRDSSFLSGVPGLSEPTHGGEGSAWAQSNLRPAEARMPDWDRARAGVAELLSTPVVANIFISQWLRGESHATLASLFQSYVKLLIETWTNTRSLNMDRSMAAQKSLMIRQVMPAVGFFLTIHDHSSSETRMYRGELEEKLTEYFPAEDARPQDEIAAEIKEVVEAALTARLLIVDEEDRIRFSSPHELLSSYYTAQFIWKWTHAVKSELFPGLEFADADVLVTNPNASFFREALVVYYQRLLFSDTLIRREVATRLDTLASRAAIPIHLVRTAVDEECFEKILPLNLILAGRVFSSKAVSDLAAYRSVGKSIAGKVRKMFKETNFEIVFQALQPLYKPLSMYVDEAGPANASARPKTPIDELTDMDKEWREAPDCQALCAIAKELDDDRFRALEPRRDMVKRRIVHNIRFHPFSFDHATLEWLKQFESDLSENRAVRRSMHDLITNTLRMVRGNRSLSDSDGKLWDEVDELIRRWRANYKTAFAKINDLKVESKKGRLTPENVFERTVFDVDGLPFDSLRQSPGSLSELIPLDLSKAEELVYLASSDLADSQRERQEIIVNGDLLDPHQIDEVRKRVDGEARRTFLLMLVANRSFRHQQLVIPEPFSLARIKGVPYQPVARYDRTELLCTLLRGAAEGLDSGNSEAHAIGGIQLYDHYAQTVWHIANYVPASSAFSFLI